MFIFWKSWLFIASFFNLISSFLKHKQELRLFEICNLEARSEDF